MFGKVKKKGWGTIDPACTIVNNKGQVIVDPLTVENMQAYGDELMDGKFNAVKFRGLDNGLDRLEYLHESGYCAVEIPEGYIVSFLDKPSVKGEDHLRREYEEWSSRSKRKPTTSTPYKLIPDAKTAISVVRCEDTSDISLAEEYVAFRDRMIGIVEYDTEMMNMTIVTARGLADRNADTIGDCIEELEQFFEGNLKESDAVYLDGLMNKLNRLMD